MFRSRTHASSPQRRRPRAFALAGVCALVLGVAGPASAAGVSPAAVNETADPGASLSVDKTVTTPEVPPRPDVVLLADTTGSMGSSLANVKAQLGDITSTVTAAQPDAQFAVTSYRDTGDGAEYFRVRSPLTAVVADVQTGVDGLFAGGGGDQPEGQLNALTRIATGAVSFRPSSTRIVVWFGDASGHDPSNGATRASTISALQAAGIRVIAINVPGGDGIDVGGQASAIAAATGGTYQAVASSDDLSAQIVAGLMNLPTTVTWSLGACSPSLTVGLTPSERTVTSGDDALFDETIAVGATAAQGTTLTCSVQFLLNGISGGPDYLQSISVRVNDVTPPVVVVDDKTVEATGPAGAVVAYPATATDDVDGVLTPTCTPPSGSQFALGATQVSCSATDAAGLTGSDTATMRVLDTTAPTGSCPAGPNPGGKVPSSANPDGFYRLVSTDAVDISPDIYVVDASAQSVRFGPYASGTTIKLTQANTRQNVKPGDGAVKWKITLKGDALLVAVDDVGNTSTVATCLVPRPPK